MVIVVFPWMNFRIDVLGPSSLSKLHYKTPFFYVEVPCRLARVEYVYNIPLWFFN